MTIANSEDQATTHVACEIYSGRVGRSQAAKELEPQTIFLAVQAHIRHEYTRYDELFTQGMEKMTRAIVREKIDEVLRRWRGNDHPEEAIRSESCSVSTS